MAWPPPVLPTTRTDTTVMTGTHPADHNAANLAINDTVAFVKPTAWTALTLTAPWTNIAGNQPAQYRKVGDTVELRGMLQSGTNGSSPFTLPAGHRPPVQQDVAVTSYGAGPVAALAVVSTAGAFQVYSSALTQIGINVRFSTVT